VAGLDGFDPEPDPEVGLADPGWSEQDRVLGGRAPGSSLARRTLPHTRGVLTDGDRWGLVRGGRRIADLVITGADFPWAEARVERLSGFEDVDSLFRAEVAALRAMEADYPTWEAAHEAISAAVELVRPDGTVVPEFLLHVEGDDAWWRWSDEPFEPET